METKFTPKTYPEDCFYPEQSHDEVVEVRRVEKGLNEYMGAVIPGHSAHADCFEECNCK